MIKTVIDHLNRKMGYRIPTDYYKNIDAWDGWWRGFSKDFHEYTELQNDRKVKRQMYRLNMANKVCQDWASLLLNEQTEITTDDDNSTAFLTDLYGDKTHFWSNANALVERAFATGTGAIVLKLDDMAIADDGGVLVSGETEIYFDYIPANMIVPLTVKQGKIIEVAFVSEVLEKGETFIYLETHTLEGVEYVIRNTYFKNEKGKLKEWELPSDIAPEVHTGSPYPWFAIIKPNIVNVMKDPNGMGMSIFALAIDNLKGVDLAFNNFLKDFKLGGKKVFYSESLVRRDEDGRAITPDDMMQQLFSVIGDLPIREDGQSSLMHEHNPTLRVGENKEGLQSQLDYLSFKCGLGTKHYQFNAGSVVTATQYMGDKQELVQNASKHMLIVEDALKTISRAALWVGKEILGANIDPLTEVTVTVPDGFIIDTETERLRDLQEIREGLMLPYEYRMTWYGEDEETARKKIDEMQQVEPITYGAE